ncbi:MAG: hypothetical protein WAL46_01350 [Nitrososphaeraceae archaeon]
MNSEVEQQPPNQQQIEWRRNRVIVAVAVGAIGGYLFKIKAN